MTYEEFKVAYVKAFNLSMKYSPNEVGASMYAQKMSDLSVAYPDFAEQVENER